MTHLRQLKFWREAEKSRTEDVDDCDLAAVSDDVGKLLRR